MIRIFSVAAAAAAILAAIAATPGIVSGVEARASQPAVNSAAKGDRLDLVAAGPDCSRQAWPYYEPRCLRGAAGQTARQVRIVGDVATVTGVK